MENRVASIVEAEIERTIDVFKRFAADEKLIREVQEVGELCAKALHAGKKIMLAGNGGSAADSQHIAAEFVSRLAINRAPLAAIALTTDSSILTAAANDYGYELVFDRQIRALGAKGDVFIGISTSGNSPNIVCALEAAHSVGVSTVVLTGASGGRIAEMADHVLKVPSERTQNIQEVHIMIGHTICAIAEADFLPKKASR